MTITTDTPKNFTKAENDLFSWCDSWNDVMLHKATKKGVRGLTWAKDGEPLEGETREAASAFWSELAELQKADRDAKWSDESLENWNNERKAYADQKSLIDDMDSEDSDY